MATGLIIKFTLTESADSLYVALKDTTGVYHVTTNPNGYGITGFYNSGRAISDIQGAWIRITKPKESTYYSTILLNATDARALAGGTDYNITNAVLGGVSTTKLESGVYTVEYIPFFFGDSGDIFTGVSTNNYITFGTGDTVDFTNATKFQYLGAGTIYEVVSVDSSTVVTFGELLGATLSSNMSLSYVGYGETHYIDVKNQIDNCLAVKVAALSIKESCGESCSDCGNTTWSCAVELLMTNIALYQAIDLNMQLFQYNKAQSLIDLLTKYCNNKCGCGRN